MDAAPLEQVIGERVRSHRSELGLTQDEVARAARLLGLGWGRSTVAMLEAGEHALSAPELLLLPLVLGIERQRTVTFNELLAGVTEHVALTPSVTVTVKTLTESLEASWTGMEKHLRITPSPLGFGDYTQVSGPESYLHERQREARDEAVQKSARRLGVSADSVVTSAHRLWGRGLVDEREARLADQDDTGDFDASTRQALRGHVTRQLLAELDTALRASKAKPRAGKKKGRR